MLQTLSQQPILIALAIVIAVSVVLAFVFPSLVKITQTLGFEIFSHDSKKVVKGLRKHPIQLLVAVAIVVGMLALGYYLYSKDLPVQIAASSFVRQERAELDKIQNEPTPAAAIEATDQLVLIDIRGAGFYREHIQGAYAIPLEIFRLEEQPISHKRVAVYSDNLKDSQEAANYLKKQRNLKIYIIKDGYEGLKAAGLKIQENYAE